ncbi:MAG: helix-turn-helix domain-containing protein [Bacteroidota bacterium]
MNEIIHICTISETHQKLGLNAPKHPLISLYHDEEIDHSLMKAGSRFSSDLYLVMFKDGIDGAIGYGRNTYDFQSGTLIFVAPHQVITIPESEELRGNKGWFLSFHPDLIRKSHLGKDIDDYTFFSYESNEALHLSEEEQKHVKAVVNQIQREYSQSIDKHSQRLIISNLELFLNYCNRFYDRQFYTRTNLNKDFVTQFERLLKDYFNSTKPSELGIPSIPYLSQQLHMSANYLSDLLKKETGKSAKAHINELLIDKAKTALLHSSISVSEIAYDLGFEYPQSFSRLFKAKTGITPLEYRNMN